MNNTEKSLSFLVLAIIIVAVIAVVFFQNQPRFEVTRTREAIDVNILIWAPSLIIN
jgi:hypothetical protein